MQRFHYNNSQAYAVAVGFLVMLGSLIFVICFSYYGWLQSTIRAESNSYLQELSQKSADTVQRTVDNYFGILDTTEALLQNTPLDSVDQMRAAIDRQRAVWRFRDLLLIDEAGRVLDDSGKKVFLPKADFLRETIVSGKRVISPAQIINGAECILFTIPVSGITVADTPIHALGVTYLLDAFDDILSTPMFSGKAYTNIINRDGTVAVPSASPEAACFGYNLIFALEKGAPEKQDAIDGMKANLAQGTGGQFECFIDGKNSYITYQPLDMLNWCLVTVVPVDVANAKTQSLLHITLWFCAFVVLLVTVLVLLLTLAFFRNKRNLEQLAFEDPVTGGNTLQRFNLLTSDLLKQADPSDYALIYTNLERFRILNEQYGRTAGNLILSGFYQLVQKDLLEKEHLCRIVDDHFCILLRLESMERTTARFEAWYDAFADLTNEQGIQTPVPQFGVYVINDLQLPLNTMVDRARFALNKIDKIQTARLQYAVYDERVHLKEVREKELEGMMEKALESGEFIVYLQPKYRLAGEVIGGAEALIRWKNGDNMIFPDEFIPLFEKNGFIIQIDLFVFEEVCKAIQRWLSQGKTPVPVSVNCSRRHFQKKDFLLSYARIFQKYQIPPQYLELELTESIVYENTDRLVEIVNQIHALGFRCSIDDFGSGYSSLNLIKDIPADTLKIDRIFFRSSQGNDERAKSVVEAIVNMARSLSMSTVAEGVEYRSQVDMLKEMQGDFVQGYVFARPLPISEFETLAFPTGDALYDRRCPE